MLYDEADECCAAKFSWLEADLCVELSAQANGGYTSKWVSEAKRLNCLDYCSVLSDQYLC
jgi:hypothetical protein